MKRPDFTSMEEAQRVSTFMEPAEVGRWRIRPFSISKTEFRLSQIKAMQESDSDEGLDMRLKRTVPVGDYICLQRLATPDERQDILDGTLVDAEISEPGDRGMWVPIMSDTPSEIGEHAHALEHAHGRVLVTGLGLGVVVSALLAKPCAKCGGTGRPHGPIRCAHCGGDGKAVKHITVVEIDRDVIALTGPYYKDEPRVSIVNQDALQFVARAYWNGDTFHYAWHDIWSHIADRNLDNDEIAEHGISYATMFKAYAPFVAMQSAWGYEEALQFRAVKMREHRATITWAQNFLAAEFEARVRMLAERIIRDRLLNLRNQATIPQQIWDWFHSDEMREQVGATPTEYARRTLEREGSNFEEKIREIITIPYTETDPMGRPNEVKEANVAR